MKKVLLGLFSLFLMVGTMNAQDPAKALKKVRGLLADYNTNQSSNTDKLDEAKKMIDLAMSDNTIAQSTKAMLLKGQVYNELANRDILNLTLNPAHVIAFPSASVDAADAYTMAFGKAEKKYDIKDATKGLQASASSLDGIGKALVDGKKFVEASKCFSKIVAISDMFKAEGLKTLFENDSDINDYDFFAGYYAYQGGDKATAKSIFSKLIDKGYKGQPAIYSTLFNIKSEDGDADALSVLEKGREMFPDDSSILFAEINHYIQKEDYDVLKVKLNEAIQADPTNPTVYSAMGNVYMNLFQENYAAGNSAKADEYFAESKKYYEEALKLDDSLFDAQYSIGSLYYNKGVEMTKQMNDLPVSEAKKYDELKGKAVGMFNEALPYFKAAEKMNPNDTNTLIALKEIFARNDDFEKSNEFKTRLQKVQDGGSNDSSYFK